MKSIMKSGKKNSRIHESKFKISRIFFFRAHCAVTTLVTPREKNEAIPSVQTKIIRNFLTLKNEKRAQRFPSIANHDPPSIEFEL